MINEIKTKLKDKINFDASPQEITNRMSSWMNANEGISFPSPQIPSLLGYNAKLDENGEYPIGYKMIPSFDASSEGNEQYGSHFPYDLSSGTNLIFVYIDIIQYQTVGDAKAHCYASLIQIDASKTVVPAALNLIIEKTSLI